MARPKPKILLRTKNDKQQSTEILEAPGVYTVLYNNKTINVRHTARPGQEKYHRTSFPSPGYAYAMARRLNKQFNTDLFTVAVMEKPENGQEDQPGMVC